MLSCTVIIRSALGLTIQNVPIKYCSSCIMLGQGQRRFKFYLNSKKSTFSWILQRVIFIYSFTFNICMRDEMDSQDVTMLERAALEIVTKCY